MTNKISSSPIHQIDLSGRNWPVSDKIVQETSSPSILENKGEPDLAKTSEATHVVSLEKMRSVNQAVEDKALEQIWPWIRLQMVTADLGIDLGLTPNMTSFDTQDWAQDPRVLEKIQSLSLASVDLNQTLNITAAADIRTWMRANPLFLQKIQTLSLAKQGLRVLPSEIGLLTNLIALDLSDNHLKALPPEIGQLTNLKGLSLNKNRLENFPEEIKNLTELKELYISCSGLVMMGLADILNLNKLEEDPNKLTDEDAFFIRSIPTETQLLLKQLHKLTPLNRLMLTGNQINELFLYFSK